MKAEAALARAGVRDVSRETCERLEIYADLLKRWNPKINLVSPKTIVDLWTRHIADSAQLFSIAPEWRYWVDMGSGAGLPGLVIAALAAENVDAQVTFIESDARKCAFMREAAQKMGVAADIRNCRIEDAAPLRAAPDIISARALAALDKLLSLAAPLAGAQTKYLFPKGAALESELTAASAHWHIEADRIPSLTDGTAEILFVRKAERHG